jgi:hypothetical protein
VHHSQISYLTQDAISKARDELYVVLFSSRGPAVGIASRRRLHQRDGLFPREGGGRPHRHLAHHDPRQALGSRLSGKFRELSVAAC